MLHHKVPIIVDIEASGFGPKSYPIEVGIALSNGTRFCRLIKPEPNWQSWSAEAEALHGISRETIEQRGVSAIQVANELNDLLDGKIIYSDGWVVDEPWLITLFSCVGITRKFVMYDIMTIMSESGLELWHRAKEEILSSHDQARHRASFDAMVVQETYLKVSNIQEMMS